MKETLLELAEEVQKIIEWIEKMPMNPSNAEISLVLSEMGGLESELFSKLYDSARFVCLNTRKLVINAKLELTFVVDNIYPSSRKEILDNLDRAKKLLIVESNECR